MRSSSERLELGPCHIMHEVMNTSPLVSELIKQQLSFVTIFYYANGNLIPNGYNSRSAKRIFMGLELSIIFWREGLSV